MSGPEGWDGKSIRQHVESAASEASSARDLAESAQDEVATLRAEMAELAEKMGAASAAQPTKKAPGRAVDADTASKFSKVQAVWSEISRWKRFVIEARYVEAALDEWETTDFPHGGSK